MNALVKKEIRLLLPSWIVAVLLALPPICTRSDDGIPVFLLFMGMAMLALTSIGRETSLNTFSSLLAQPAERMRIWNIKLSVLAAAFFVVFATWRLATIFSFHDYGGREADPEASAAVLIAGCLVLVSTFTGGLWATLLLRQIAGAFWLALLTPAVLAGLTAAFLAENYSDYTVIAVLCVVLGIYSVGGFLFARWLFFRAQDVGWTGGIIALPEWKIFSANFEATASRRNRKPIFALLKKEFQLHQVSLMGAAGLLVLHIGIIILRTQHHFAKDSAGEVLAAIFWMLWLVMAPVIGSMAISEERRLGVMEGQLCLPVSRRVQFVVKAILALFLGTFLGGAMPVLVEKIGTLWGAHNSMFAPQLDSPGGIRSAENPFYLFQWSIVALAAWLALVSFFASSLAKNFLQAIGFAIAAFIGSTTIFPAFANGRMIFFDAMPPGSILPLLIVIPTLIITLLLLTYLNFKNFRDGWPLWRRNLLGVVGAFVFALVASDAIYNRAWEIFEPAEPAHGAAKFSPANPPILNQFQFFDNIEVKFSDGKVWVDHLNSQYANGWSQHLQWIIDPLPKSVSARTIPGSNWVSVMSYTSRDQPQTIGIRNDGTLWFFTDDGKKMQMGNETDWQQITCGQGCVLLLKNDGSLWLTEQFYQHSVVRAQDFKPVPVGADFKWKELYNGWPGFARKADDSVWVVTINKAQMALRQGTNLEQAVFHAMSFGNSGVAYVRGDGTLWAGESSRASGQENDTFHFSQVGNETNWQAVAISYHMMVALKTDGTLWQWNFQNEFVDEAAKISPARLGIHNDWVAVANVWVGVVALAADGSLWLWPDKKFYDYGMLLKLPKQPRFLGNVFSEAN